MLTSRIDPDVEKEIPKDFEYEIYFDENEALRIAEFNYECLVYAEPEKQLAWRR